MGLHDSVKWVGAFVTALVGAYTIEDLWRKFGDLRLSWVSVTVRYYRPHVDTPEQRDQARHWAARVGCLIILPILVYMACFKIHFWVLNHSGPGDSQMSSLFQANLVGNDFGKNPLGRFDGMCACAGKLTRDSV